MSQQLDAQGEAREALGTAVGSYGQRVLSDPQILGNVVGDLLPDLPRERSLLVTGAEAGIAAELRQHVEEQHIDPDTAVQLVARALSERRAIDPAASTWVASEYAQALGYRVRPQAGSFPEPSFPQAFPVAPPTMTAVSRPPVTEPPATQMPPAPAWQSPAQAPGQAPQRPPGQFMPPPVQPSPQGPPTQSWPPSGQAPHAQSWPPSGQGQQGPAPQSWPPSGQGQQGAAPPPWPPQGRSWPPAQTASGGGSWSGRKRGLIAGITAAAVVAAYLVIAAVAHMVPFAKSRPVAAPSPIHSTARPTPPTSTAPVTPTPTPTPTGPVLAAGVAPLTQLLPQDIDDPATQCSDMTPPFQWKMPGLVRAMSCTDPGLPKGQVYAFQVGSHADFQRTWQNYNKWWGITTLSPGPNCPPTAGGAGTVGFHNHYFPSRAGQVLECEEVGSGKGAQPAYTWAYPTEDAFVVAQGAEQSSFSNLDKWWTNNSAPLSAPNPSAS